MKRILFLLLAGLLMLLAGCGGKPALKKDGQGKLPVVASFYAMKEMTEAIGGDRVEVTSLIPEDGTP